MGIYKQIHKKSIKELPQDVLPREKALKYGINSLSDAELIALLLGKGTKDLNVLALSEKILKNRSLKDIRGISIDDLTKIKGIGKAKALQILAISEIIRRIETEEEEISLNHPEDVYRHTKWLSKEKQEKMVVLYTNTTNQLLGEEIVAVGSINLLGIKPRDIFIYALKYNAYGIIIVHNHPEGFSSPSKEDIEFTNLIKELSVKIGFQLLDHVIIGKKDYFSFAEKNML